MKLSKLFAVCSLTASMLTLSAKDNSPIPTKFSQEFDIQGTSKEITEGGFYLNLFTVLPSEKFGNAVDSPFTFDAYGAGGGFEIGNYFRAVDLDNIAIGVKATWLSAAYVPTNTSISDLNIISGGILHVGPYLGYALNDDMVVETYYQIAPTTNVSFEGSVFTGLNHKLGLTYRYKIFAAGFEYQAGKGTDIDENEFSGESIKIYTNNLKFNLGFKF